MPLQPRVKPVTIPYASWTLSTAQSVIAPQPWMASNRAFIEGDHWQSGTGWVGPLPAIGEEGAAQAIGEIMRGFTAENVLLELAERRADGVIGREPTWTLVPREPTDDGEPTPADQSLIDEAYDLLTPWWDERGVHELLQQHTLTMLWATRASLRLFVPQGFLRDATVNGLPTRVLVARDAADALRQLYVEKPEPEYSMVYENPRTRERAGIYLYQENDQQRAELVWLDNASQQTLVQQLGGLNAAPSRLALGGRLTMYEATHPEFISEQLRQMQRALNLSLSMLPRNIVSGGFLEMIVLNGQMPGKWETNEKGERTKFVPSPFYRGAGVVNWIQGIELDEGPRGTGEQVTTPSVQFRPPTPVTHAVEANGELYQRMLATAQQVHVLLNGDGQNSPDSRIQARAEFGRSLRVTRARTQRTGRWLIETALAWVEFVTNQPGRFTGRLRCDFQCQLDVGPLTVEERAQNVAEVEAGLLSDETAMERNGVEDTDAELQRITSSPRGQLGLSTQQAAAVQAWQDIGLPFLASCEMAGVDMVLARKVDGLRRAAAADNDGNPPDPNGQQPPVGGAGGAQP